LISVIFSSTLLVILPLMSEKNRHGSEGGEASMLPDGVMSMLVERFTKRGRYFKGLLSASLTPKK
jgi:hypothetical protein